MAETIEPDLAARLRAESESRYAEPYPDGTVPARPNRLRGVDAMTTPSAARLGRLKSQRAAVGAILARYDASNLRLFGSVARGDARSGSDLDLMVDLPPSAGNALLRLAGLAEELSDLLGCRVDVVSIDLLRAEVAAAALNDAIPLTFHA